MSNLRKTQKDLFGEIKAIVEKYGTVEQVEFIDKKVAQLERKNDNRSMTATQKANEELKAIIVENLTSLNKAVTINEIQANDERLQTINGEPISNQKMSALLSQLVKANVVVKTIEKKKAYFSIAK
jgi:hypothetical protein